MRFSPLATFVSACAGILLLCSDAQAQGRGGQSGIGGSSFSGGIGGSSFGGFSGGLSGGMSGSASGFRTSGLSQNLNRGGGFFGQQTNYFGQSGYAGNTLSGGISGNNFGMSGGFSGGMAGNRGFLGGAQMAGMSGMNNRFGQGAAVKLATATMGAALTPIPPAATDVLPRLDKILADSAPANSERDVQMEMDGSTLVLKGTVGSEREKRLAEAMLRLEPGVYDIRNDLQVRAPPANKTPPIPPKPKP